MTTEDHEMPEIFVLLEGIGLLGSAVERRRFVDKIGSDLIEMGQTEDHVFVGKGGKEYNPGPATLLNLEGDRIHFLAAPYMSAAAMRDPASGDLPRLARAAGIAINLSDIRRQKLGDIVYVLRRTYRQTDGTDAAAYLADRLFGGRKFGFDEWDLIGGRAELTHGEPEAGDRQWHFTIKPLLDEQTGDDTVHLITQLIVSSQRLPRRSHMLASLEEVWHRSLNFAAQLDAMR